MGKREARFLAFHGVSRHKVVTLEGALFSKAGTITGGFTKPTRSNWSDKMLKRDLEDDYQRLKNEICTLPQLENGLALKSRSCTEEIENLSNSVAALRAVTKERLKSILHA